MKTEQELLGPRKLLAVTLRRKGMTYREIGENIGVGHQRASQMVAQGERLLERIRSGVDEVELGVRAQNVLNNAGIGSSRESVREAIESGVLHPKKSGTMAAMRELNEPKEMYFADGDVHFREPDPSPRYLRNYGWKTHKICCEYAGIPCRREELRLEQLRAEVKRIEEKIEIYEKRIRNQDNERTGEGRCQVEG
tara:strand:+ start:3780 stop:4364 length:585 start_codon:yes stop_codon:yes gene_type:complete